MTLQLTCECGYKRKSLTVGATFDVHYKVAICFGCRRIFSTRIKSKSARRRDLTIICQVCGDVATELTNNPNMWIPVLLSSKYEKIEPWLLGNLELLEKEEYDLIDKIRLMCPKCRKHTLSYIPVEFWDE